MHSCSPKGDAPLLEGKLNVTEPTEIAFVYDHDGDNIVTELTTDSSGTFTYDPQLEGDEADLVIYVGQHLYGAYVRQSCSTHAHIHGTKATFTGDHPDRGRFNHTLFQPFPPVSLNPTPNPPIPRLP